jgi:hypothetical protein
MLPDDQSPAEPELAPLMCAFCQAEMVVEEEPWPETCPTCSRMLDLPTQFAYSRGRDAFIAGQNILITVSPKKRRKDLTTEEEMEGLHYYIQAYSSLQQAFMRNLAESQRQLGIEMMAAIAQVFSQHGIVSPLEVSYWTTLMIEVTTQLEQAGLKEKLANPARGGFMGMILRLRWQIRKNQLEKALVNLDLKIQELERRIAFVDKPRARKKLSLKTQ